jgi:hypothetical protein
MLLREFNSTGKERCVNHRCGERHVAGLTVLLRRPGWRGCFVGKLIDLSISGAFVETRVWAFPLHSVVRVEVAGSAAGSARPMRCHAMVARASRTGIGLMFDGIGPLEFAPLFVPEAKAGARHGLLPPAVARRSDFA